MKEVFPNVRVIAMSGGGHQTRDNVLGAASMLGAVTGLEKSFDVQEVLEAVELSLKRDEEG